jgi:hypothetical protein
MNQGGNYFSLSKTQVGEPAPKYTRSHGPHGSLVYEVAILFASRMTAKLSVYSRLRRKQPPKRIDMRAATGFVVTFFWWRSEFSNGIPGYNENNLPRAYGHARGDGLCSNIILVEIRIQQWDPKFPVEVKALPAETQTTSEMEETPPDV